MKLFHVIVLLLNTVIIAQKIKGIPDKGEKNENVMYMCMLIHKTGLFCRFTFVPIGQSCLSYYWTEIDGGKY